MKKQILLGLGLLAAITASAQVAIVKEVERNLKSKIEDYPNQMTALKPAFTNEETAQSAYPYFVAGKYGYDYFVKQDVLKNAGMEVNVSAMGHALIDGYNNLVKALALDTVYDAKGKAKTKYSKDIIKFVKETYNNFDGAGIALYGIQDYDGAYNAWELLFSAPVDPVLGINAPTAYPDSVLNVISFNQGLAAYQGQNWENSLRAFDRAIALGNTSKNVFDIAMAAASNYPDSVRSELIAKYAEMAYPIYGKEDDRYIGNIINNMLQKGEYSKAEGMLKEYIAQEPENAQLYFILGVLYDSEKATDTFDPKEAAIEAFKKCVSLDPDHAMANVLLGQLLFNKAAALDEQQSGTLNSKEYYEYLDTTVNPMLREAAAYFEHAYQVDPENSYTALANLRSIYYFLKDQENLDRIEKLQ